MNAAWPMYCIHISVLDALAKEENNKLQQEADMGRQSKAMKAVWLYKEINITNYTGPG